MKYKFLILLFLGSVFTTQAQYKKSIAYHPEIYIGVNGGLNSYWAEGVGSYIQTQPLSSIGPLFRWSMGYNFSPYLGVRGMLGFAGHNWPDNRNNAVQTFSAENLTVDFMVNLSNLFYYKPKRAFDLYLFGGTGAAYRNAFSGVTAQLSYIIRGGLQGDILLTPSLDLNLSGEVNVVADSYNGYPTSQTNGMPFDVYPALSVGLTYHFNALRGCRFVKRRIRW